MKLLDKFKKKKTILDNSPKLKKGEFKKILLPLMEKNFPDFQYAYYKNRYYSFQRTREVHQMTVYESIDIGFTLKDKYCICSVASRLNPFFVGSSGYNNGWINPHYDLMVLKKGTGIIPLEEAFYYHNSKIQTTTRIIHEIISDLKKYGLRFINHQYHNLKTNPLIIEGLQNFKAIDYDNSKLKAEIELQQKKDGNKITKFNHPIYFELKKSLQKMKGISRENRKRIPKLTHELIEILVYNE
ncbi:hypothetical protein GCM10009430_46150 [Aquimarina litoralis]|uniref:Uncharacterized protein n=1 Tax=Aquimarina litoralis TaxID=584605 RepID=A0ABN1J9A5_9FLAO